MTGPTGQSLVGRTDALDQLRRALSVGDVVQVVGPPGIGKTALVEALTAALKREGRRVLEIGDPLPPEAGRAGVLEWLARACGAPVEFDAVATALLEGEPRVDVVWIDDPEASGAAGPQASRDLAGLLLEVLDAHRGGPAPTVLWTTRRRIPDLASRGPAIEVGPLDDDAALALFRLRAAEVGAGPIVDAEEAAVRALVAHLEGWPLALELAGSQMRLFSPAELLADPARAVLRSPRGGPPSLMAALQRSWEAIDPGDQAALASVSWFCGPFDRTAFEAVADASLDVLERLLDASLLQWRAMDGGRAYRVLSPIRSFVREVEAPEPAAFDRYAEWVLTRCEGVLPDATGSQSRQARTTLARWAPDLEQLHRAGLQPDPPGTAEQAARAVLALAALAEARGPVNETIERLAAVPRDALPVERAKRLDLVQAEMAIRGFDGEMCHRLVDPWPDSPTVLRLRGLSAIRRGQLAEAIATLEQAVALADSGDATDPVVLRERAHTRFALGAACTQDARVADSAAVLHEARVAVRAVDAPDLEGLILKFLASAERALGTPVASRIAWLERALELHRRTGNIRLEAMALDVLVVARMDARDPRADDALEEGLQTALRAGMRSTVHQMGFLRALDAVGSLARGEMEDVLDRAHRALDALESGPHPPHRFMTNWITLVRGIIAAHRGQRAVALAHVASAREGAESLGLRGDALQFACVQTLLRDGPAPEPPEGLPDGAPLALLTRLAVEAESGRPLSAEVVRQAEAFVELRAFVGVTTAGAGVEVAADGSWFRPAGGDRVDLSRRRVLRRVLAGLAARQGSAAEGALTVSDLLAAGWPGESPKGSSGRARVHVAIADLRKLGLRDALQTVPHEGGSAYRLDAITRS
jgi:hypothetical protein